MAFYILFYGINKFRRVHFGVCRRRPDILEQDIEQAAEQFISCRRIEKCIFQHIFTLRCSLGTFLVFSQQEQDLPGDIFHPHLRLLLIGPLKVKPFDLFFQLTDPLVFQHVLQIVHHFPDGLIVVFDLHFLTVAIQPQHLVHSHDTDCVQGAIQTFYMRLQFFPGTGLPVIHNGHVICIHVHFLGEPYDISRNLFPVQQNLRDDIKLFHLISAIYGIRLTGF